MAFRYRSEMQFGDGGFQAKISTLAVSKDLLIFAS